MKASQYVYRKNFSLIIAFFTLVTIILIGALIVTYKLTSNDVTSEFSFKKNDVLKQTTSPYSDFFIKNKVPEITSYYGLLDSASAGAYTKQVFNDYPFVKKIVFYQIRVGKPGAAEIGKNKIGISISSTYQYKLEGKTVVASNASDEIIYDDFKVMANKLSDYVTTYDSTKTSPSPSEILSTFWDIKPAKISYLNIPSADELKTYQDIQKSANAFYRQNMMTFSLDTLGLKVKNSHPELYQNISIRPIIYDPVDIDSTKTITDEVALPGAFSNYKLYFNSQRDYLTAEINRRFMPMGGVVLLIYLFMVAIGWLIYRNLDINMKLFKLQYDFINNFTHEFKTPVSVIKIAGSNLRGDGELSDRQLKHYGKILDEEADKLNELMNKLLSFTQLENRSITIKKDKINIDKFTQGYIDTFKIKYPDFNLHCIIKGVTEFNSDPVLLGSVFQNLIENAYKYSHHDNKELLIRVVHDRRHIVFSFIDKGIGIPKHELNNIFKKWRTNCSKYS
jgi:two-component system phosphate regulon sensor histidine kinase PhoR